MNVDFTRNRTVFEVGRCPVPDAVQRRIVTDILQGMNLPLTEENLLVATYSLLAGMILQKRRDRQRKHSGRQ